MSLPSKDLRSWKIGDHGELTVPREFIEAAGLGPKMFVKFKIEGKTIVIEKAPHASANPLDAPLGKKLDKDIFSKIQSEQSKEKDRLREQFEKGLKEKPKDGETPPDHPFRWD